MLDFTCSWSTLRFRSAFLGELLCQRLNCAKASLSFHAVAIVAAAASLAVESSVCVGIFSACVILVLHARGLGRGGLNLSGIKLGHLGGGACFVENSDMCGTAGCSLAPGLGGALLGLDGHVAGVTLFELLHAGGRADAHGLVVLRAFLSGGKLGHANGLGNIFRGLFGQFKGLSLLHNLLGHCNFGVFTHANGFNLSFLGTDA